MTEVPGLGGHSQATSTPRLSQTAVSSVRHFLFTSAYAPKTVAAYTAAVARYRSHCPHFGRHASPLLFDDCVCEYICWLFVHYDGRNRQLAVNAVYGIYMLHPEVREQLRASEQLLRGWKRYRPSVSYRPLTWPIAIAIARTMAGNGYSHCAIATLVAFEGLLRVSELIAVTVADVSFPNDSRRGGSSRASSQSASSSTLPSRRHAPSAVIRLATTKTGSNQTAAIRDPHVISLLRHYVTTRPSRARLFPFPTSAPADYFRKVLRSACAALDMAEQGFTPHSLRHGGATHAHMNLGVGIEDVLLRGRWKSNSSARTYLQSGTAALITTELSEGAQRYVRELESHWYSALWTDCFQPCP